MATSAVASPLQARGTGVVAGPGLSRSTHPQLAQQWADGLAAGLVVADAIGGEPPVDVVRQRHQSSPVGGGAVDLGPFTKRLPGVVRKLRVRRFGLAVQGGVAVVDGVEATRVVTTGNEVVEVGGQWVVGDPSSRRDLDPVVSAVVPVVDT